MRNVRNAFVNHNLILPGYNVIVNSKQLLDLRRKYPEILTDEVLPPVAYAPTDKMSMKDCLLLFNSKVIEALSKVEDRALTPHDKSIASATKKFILIMLDYYRTMEDNKPLNEKMQTLYGEPNSNSSTLSFLRGWQHQNPNSALAPITFKNLNRTIVNLHQLQQEINQRGISFPVKTSVLSTLVVEHGYGLLKLVSCCNN